MRIFLSYASEDRALIEPIRLALAAQKHDIFFDREDLPPGEEYDGRIREAIERCDLFIGFLTPNALDVGSYTLTELAIAARCWPHPSGRVLPVLLRPVAFEQIPAYLRSVTVLEPTGNAAASVADAVHQAAGARRRKRLRTLGVLAGVAAALIAGFWWVLHGRVSSSADGAPTVLIPAGVFTMGDDELSPKREIYVAAFRMDAHEVTTGRYAKFLGENPSVTPPEDWGSVDLGRHGTLPVVGVDWRDADAYCRWADKRLPTEAEWEKAARGADARMFPWGEEPPSPQSAAYGRSADAAYEGGLETVGAHPLGRSELGVHDLAGNASEWVSDWYAEGFARGDVRDPKGPSSGPGKVIRGGGWRDPAARLSATQRFYAGVEHRSDDLGFRCAQDLR